MEAGAFDAGQAERAQAVEKSIFPASTSGPTTTGDGALPDQFKTSGGQVFKSREEAKKAAEGYAGSVFGRGAPSILETLLAGGGDARSAPVAAAMAGAMFGHVGVAASAIAALRNAGVQRVDELLRDALPDPKLAKTLLEKVATKPGEQDAQARRLAVALRRIVVAAPASAEAGRALAAPATSNR